ncbi:MAG: hypothetical protein ACKOU6_13135 [Planctomycetota bacterium]
MTDTPMKTSPHSPLTSHRTTSLAVRRAPLHNPLALRTRRRPLALLRLFTLLTLLTMNPGPPELPADEPVAAPKQPSNPAAANPAAAAKANFTPDRAQWRDLTTWVGTWKGVGQARRGSSAGAWTETATWSWDFADQQPTLKLKIERGKYLRQLTLRHQADTQQFELRVELVGERPALKLPATLQDDGALVAVHDKIDGDVPERFTIRAIANGDRLMILLEKRGTISERFNRIAEVGYTRQGSDFGKGATFVECVVTGGLGTIPVEHDGQTYYVCCAGCRDLFVMKPAEILAEYRERKQEAARKKASASQPRTDSESP